MIPQTMHELRWGIKPARAQPTSKAGHPISSCAEHVTSHTWSATSMRAWVIAGNKVSLKLTLSAKVVIIMALTVAIKKR